ncbi:MAG TPA: flagellar biosynthetic protein FliR [Phycisphaerae bacterium]|nr:flagellar biosynthetic protein FliR [Phycisphaerae bacterium]
MPLQLMDFYVALPALMLVMARVSGLMLSAPLFSGASVPTSIKALLVLAISMAAMPLLGPAVQVPVTMTTALAGLVGELALGLLIGFCVSLVLAGVQVAIQTVSQQAGMALGEVFNPTIDTSTPVAAELYFYVSMVIFLAVGGHRALTCAVLDSFATIPLMGFRVSEGVAVLVVELLAVSFIVAVRVGGPIILALLLGFMTLGFLSRTIPQLHLLSVGFPIKIALGLLFMAMTMMSLEPVLLDALTQAMDELRSTLGMGA